VVNSPFFLFFFSEVKNLSSEVFFLFSFFFLFFFCVFFPLFFFFFCFFFFFVFFSLSQKGQTIYTFPLFLPIVIRPFFQPGSCLELLTEISREGVLPPLCAPPCTVAYILLSLPPRRKTDLSFWNVWYIPAAFLPP